MLAEVGRVRRQTRRTLAEGSWRYLLVWSVVFFGSWVSSFFSLGSYYWIIGVPLGYLGMWSIYRDQEPVAWNRDAPYWLTGLAIAVVNVAAGLMLPNDVVVVVVWVVLGTGFGVLSCLDRQPGAAGLFFGLAAASGILGLVVDDRFGLYRTLALVFTSATAGASLSLWLWSRSQNGPSNDLASTSGDVRDSQ